MDKIQQDILKEMEGQSGNIRDRRVIQLVVIFFVAIVMGGLAWLYLALEHNGTRAVIQIAAPHKVKTIPPQTAAQADLGVLSLNDPRAAAKAEERDAAIKIFKPKEISLPKKPETPEISLAEIDAEKVPNVSSGQGLASQLLDKPKVDIGTVLPENTDDQQRMQQLKQKILAGIEPAEIAAQDSAVADSIPQSGDSLVVVQVSSLSNEEDAQHALRTFRKNFADHLNAYSLRVQPIVLSSGTMTYRLYVVGFARYDEALQWCDALKNLGGDCLPRRLS